MSMAEMELLRHSPERGDLLRLLKEDYHRELTEVGSLLGAMDMLQKSISIGALRFHLKYLEDQGYVQLRRNRDMPGWRADRAVLGHPDDIRFARLLPRGLALLDGKIAEDPLVRF